MRSGDGWTRCGLGHRHWGLFGAAGLLVIREQDLLLQLRSVNTHNGQTWSTPGGARDPKESATEAAMRESHEEIGVAAGDVEPVGEFVDDHGGWTYTTVIARLLRPILVRQNFESSQVRWVPVEEVSALDLHPGFASTWPQISQLLTELNTGPP